jgi:chemotaxis protein methyltransferase CheR
MSLTTSDFDYIRDVVRRQSAIVLEPGKEYLVESRLVPLRARRASSPSPPWSRACAPTRPARWPVASSTP